MQRGKELQLGDTLDEARRLFRGETLVVPVLDGDRYVATVHTQGPWSEGFQHAGPPSALLARAIDKVGREGAITIEDGSGLASELEGRRPLLERLFRLDQLGDVIPALAGRAVGDFARTCDFELMQFAAPEIN